MHFCFLLLFFLWFAKYINRKNIKLKIILKVQSFIIRDLPIQITLRQAMIRIIVDQVKIGHNQTIQEEFGIKQNRLQQPILLDGVAGVIMDMDIHIMIIYYKTVVAK